MKHEVCRLKQSMYGAFEKLEHVFMDRKLNMGIRLSVFNSVVSQQGLYGCQGWNLQVEDMRALESVYGRLLRRTIGIRDPNMPAIDVITIAREHNDRIYPLECQIRQTQLRYMGHVVRRDGSGRPQVTREVAFGFVEGDAKGGGHLLDFKRMVKASLVMFNIPTDSWESIARSEKDRWRKMLKDGMGVALNNWIVRKKSRRGTGSERDEGGIDDVEEGSEDAVQALLYADMDGDANEDENPGGMSNLEKLRYIFAFIDAVCEARRVVNEARSMTSSEVVVEESQYDKEDGKSYSI